MQIIYHGSYCEVKEPRILEGGKITWESLKMKMGTVLFSILVSIFYKRS